MGGDAMTADVAVLLAAEGVAAPDLSLERCNVGGNNRVFVVRAGDQCFVAKWYFTHPGDSRDRLLAESSFIGYAMRAGIRAVPRLVSADRRRNLAVYEYVPGRKLAAGEVAAHHVQQAARFLEALNAPAARSMAADLPDASEACFSLADHVLTIERRIARFASIEPVTASDRAAIEFVGRLADGWGRLRGRLERDAQSVAALTGRLPAETRCVSPSDFGFHNALVRESGELCFIDFEYAGWDDPAKTIGDFFSQPAVPVPMRFFDEFAHAASRFAPEPERIVERARRLLPLFQLKWCCIMLNVFLPVSRERRRFADPALDEESAKERQLDLARTAFSGIQI